MSSNTHNTESDHLTIATRVMEPYLKVYMDQMKPLDIDWRDEVTREADDLFERQNLNFFAAMLLLVLFPIGCVYLIWYGVYWTERRHKRLGY